MKKVLLFIVIVVVIGLGVYAIVKQNPTTGTKNENTNSSSEANSNENGAPAPLSDIKTTPGSDVTIYIGQGCPHCQKVEDYIKTNKIDEKAQFDIKEVWYNKDNNAELSAKAEICKIPQNDLGVPLLFDKKTSKCFVGETEIDDFLKQLAGI